MSLLQRSQYSRALIQGIFICLLSFPLLSNAASIDFEMLSDGDNVTSQYPGLTFSNATALKSGISLNEFEFPPHSGVTVISDNGGSLSISFSSRVSMVSGYFTYQKLLTMVGYDASNNAVATSTSSFSNNTAMSGSLGSNPNELISIAFSGGISRLTITGDIGGASFVLDDLSHNPVPIPAALFLVAPCLPALFFRRRRIA